MPAFSRNQEAVSLTYSNFLSKSGNKSRRMLQRTFTPPPFFPLNPNDYKNMTNKIFCIFRLQKKKNAYH